MFAVVETGGKQFKVSQGDVIQVEKLDTPVGETLVLQRHVYELILVALLVYSDVGRIYLMILPYHT